MPPQGDRPALPEGDRPAPPEGDRPALPEGDRSAPPRPAEGMPGRFLTFEGGEGVGKSTQLRLLAEALAARGQDVLTTREPGGAPGAEVLRSLLLGGGHDWSPLAETLLHVAARAEHVARTLRPALLAGRWVLCDRFTDSTLAYQGYGQGADRDAIATLSRLVGLAPALTVVLDAPEATARTRLAARGDPADRYERLGQGFHARVAAGFRAIAAGEPGRCVLVDAGGSVQDVHRAVLQAVLARWPEAAGPA